MGVKSLPDFVISDTHFFHGNIIKYCGRPRDHDVMQVKRWAKVVNENHTILHLGDVFFGGSGGYERFGNEIAPKLTGKKYLILGNHDPRKYDYAALGFTVIKPFTLPYRSYEVSFDHYPKLLDPDEDRKKIHVHGHIHTNPYARGEMTRFANVNVSVEMLDYRPHRTTRLLNREILHRNGKKRYTNSRHFRFQKRNQQRRAV